MKKKSQNPTLLRDSIADKRAELIKVIEDISTYSVSTLIPPDLQKKRKSLEKEILSLERQLTALAETEDGSTGKKPDCFVIMPFRDPFNSYYKDIIKPAVEQVGYRAIRADEIYHPTAFIQTIWDCILSSQVVVAEMTNMNPNVLYELGLCHAVNRVVVMITQKIDDVPSDLRHINLIKYDTTRPNWADELRLSIQKMVQNAPTITNRDPYIKPVAIPETTIANLQSQHKTLTHDNEILKLELDDIRRKSTQLQRRAQRLEAQNKAFVSTIADKDTQKITTVSKDGEPDTFIVPLRHTGLTLEFLLVPEGPFLFGDGNSRHRINLPTFFMSKYAITNTQFAAFLNEKGNQLDEETEWINLSGSSPADKCRILQKDSKFIVEKGFENHPVTYVNWYGANAFCQWAGVELPTDQQWEKAARGPNGFLYPWGNTPPNPSLTNYGEKDWPRDVSPVPVDEYPDGRSPYGCYQMIGNVWHWTSTFWSERQTQAVRGGSFLDYRVGGRSVYRFLVHPNGPDFSQGFMVCKRWLE